MLTFCSGCINASDESKDHLSSTCGSSEFSEVLALTEKLVEKSYTPTFPSSPYYEDLSNGCVGLSFSINMEGVPFDIEIRRTSHLHIFSRSAKRAIQKYRFQKSKEGFKSAYLIIYFSLDD